MLMPYEPVWATPILMGDNRLVRYSDFPQELIEGLQNLECIYIMESEEAKVTKIGRSYNPEVRLKALQTGNHTKLEIRQQFGPFFKQETDIVEKECHKSLRASKLEGEWFSMAFSDCFPIVSSVIQSYPDLLSRLNSVTDSSVVGRYIEVARRQAEVGLDIEPVPEGDF